MPSQTENIWKFVYLPLEIMGSQSYPIQSRKEQLSVSHRLPAYIAGKIGLFSRVRGFSGSVAYARSIFLVQRRARTFIRTRHASTFYAYFVISITRRKA